MGWLRKWVGLGNGLAQLNLVLSIDNLIVLNSKQVYLEVVKMSRTGSCGRQNT